MAWIKVNRVVVQEHFGTEKHRLGAQEPVKWLHIYFSSLVFNRPGVAGVVLQSHLSLIHWVGDPFIHNPQDCLSQTVRADILRE